MKLLNALFCLVVFSASAQQETVFKVTHQGTAQLAPNIDTLLYNKEYLFKVKGALANDLGKAQFDGGTAIITDSGILIKTMKQPVRTKKYHLYVFGSGAHASEFIIEKDFTILPPLILNQIPVPVMLPRGTVFYFANWGLRGMDSISKVLVHKATQLQAIEFTARNAEDKISEYTIEITCNGLTNTFKSLDGNFRSDIIKALQQTTEGCTIVFRNIKYQNNTTGDNAGAGPFKIVVKK